MNLINIKSNLLSVIIPVLNEELLLPRAINSAKRLGVEIFILDSGSTDNTVKLSETAGCIVHQGLWGSFSEKLNWGLTELPILTPWVIRLDADEYLTETLINEINSGILESVGNHIDGFWIDRHIFFMGKRIRFGGQGAQPNVRIMRVGHTKYEQRLTDEHVLAKGQFSKLRGAIVDDPDRGLAAWLRKHVAYAETESFSAYRLKKESTWRNLHGSAKFRRFLKEKIYNSLPKFLRPTIFFIYRYIFLFGFLDGYRGAIFHFLHAFWYRFIIDALILESEITNGKFVKKTNVM